MCGRFVQKIVITDLAHAFKSMGIPWENTYPQNCEEYNLAPGQKIWIVTFQQVSPFQARGQKIVWGYRNKKGFYQFNTRMETYLEKSRKRYYYAELAFILMNGYYEWLPSKPQPQPYYIFSRQHTPFWAMGIVFSSPTEKKNRWCSILTRPALPQLTWLHSRMPMVFPFQSIQNWYDSLEKGQDSIPSSLLEWELDLEWYPVSPKVNAVSTPSSPDLIRPFSPSSSYLPGFRLES